MLVLQATTSLRLPPSGPLGSKGYGVVDTRARNGTPVRLFYPTRKDVETPAWFSRPAWLTDRQYLAGLMQYAFNLEEKPLWQRVAATAIQLALVPVFACLKAEGAVWQAPCAEQPMGVVVFSHGLAGFHNTYGGLCGRIAQHAGVVVAAVEHADGSACNCEVKGEKGDVTWVAYKHTDGNLLWRQQQLRQRVEELSEVMNLLESIDAGKETVQGVDFKGRLRVDAPTVAGHSFGACTAMRASELDARFVRTLAFDPWLYALGDDPAALRVLKPLCVLNSEGWNPSWRAGPEPGRNAERMALVVRAREQAAAPAILSAEVAGSRHMSVSDIPWLLDGVPGMQGLTMSTPEFTASEKLDVFATLSVAFLLQQDFAQLTQQLAGVLVESAAAEPAMTPEAVAA